MRSRLQQRILRPQRTVVFEDAENGADAAADIEIGRSVERIEQHAVLMLLSTAAGAQQHRLGIFLGGNDGNPVPTANRAHEYFVGHHVELGRLARIIIEARTPDARGDYLGGYRQRRENPGEGAADRGLLRFLLQNVRLQRNRTVGVRPMRCSGRAQLGARFGRHGPI